MIFKYPIPNQAWQDILFSIFSFMRCRLPFESDGREESIVLSFILIWNALQVIQQVQISVFDILIFSYLFWQCPLLSYISTSTFPEISIIGCEKLTVYQVREACENNHEDLSNMLFGCQCTRMQVGALCNLFKTKTTCTGTHDPGRTLWCQTLTLFMWHYCLSLVIHFYISILTKFIYFN